MTPPATPRAAVLEPTRAGGRGTRSRRSAARAVLTLAGVLACSAVPAAGAPDRTAAMAFIRVVGDLRAEFTQAWRQPVLRPNVEVATGSGFVIAPSGLVLTSHHVVSSEPIRGELEGEEVRITAESARIEVVVGGGAGERRVLEGWVAAADPEADLAVLQVTASDLPHVPLGDSDALEPGASVRVLGFPFGRRTEVAKRPGPDVVPGVSVTSGSLSAARADEAGETRFLQTDASVSPGSSGGPMLDEEGYAIGVVRMKLAPGPAREGAGFTVPINLVKEFLEARGLLHLLPVTPLRRGVVHSLDWKMLRVEMADGFADEATSRLQVESADATGAVSFAIRRLATPLGLERVELSLLDGRSVPGFVPAPAQVVRRVESGRPRPRVLGSASGTGTDGTAFRVEYALVALRGEVVAARYVGTPDDLAFNRSLVRRTLETLEAEPMLKDLAHAPSALFDPAPLFGRAGGVASIPTGWISEPSFQASCEGAGEAQAGLAASPAQDYTIVFRVLRFPAAEALDAIMGACEPEGSGGVAYSRRLVRLGLPTSVRGVIRSRGPETEVLELEAPEAKLGLVSPFFDRWVREVAAGP